MENTQQTHFMFAAIPSTKEEIEAAIKKLELEEMYEDLKNECELNSLENQIEC